MLTVYEVATLLRIHVNTVFSLIKKRSISATKVGNQWRISEDQLEEYLEARTIKRKKLTV